MSEMSSDDVPVTWPALIDTRRPLVERQVAGLLELDEELDDLGASRELAARFGEPALVLSEAVVVLGSDACRSVCTAWSRYLPAAIHAMDADVQKNVVAASYLITFAAIARCCGVALPKQAERLGYRWLPDLVAKRSALSDLTRQSMALAATAENLTELVPDLVGGGRLPARIQPGEVFEFDTRGFIRYLAASVRLNAAAADINPAWRSFLAAFPHKLAANTIEWPALIFAGIVCIANLHGDNIETVAASIHKQLIDRGSDTTR